MTAAHSGLAALFPFLVVSGVAIPDTPQVEPKPPTVKVERGIEYAAAGGEKQLLDIALPAGEGPFPCVVCLHGGAWRLGSRRDLSTPDRDDAGKPVPSIIEQLAANGYAAASVGYRLAPKHPFPAQIDDARAAVRFLRSNAKKYRLDGDRFASLGFSAGGHLALLLGLDPAKGPGEPTRTQCVVSFFGPTDLSLYSASPGLEDAYMVPVFGKDCKTDPAIYRKASPIEYVTKDAPPVLMIHGNVDVVVPVIHSERLLKKLQDAGTTAELIVVKGEGHGWTGKPAAKSTRDALAFLDAQLKGKK